MPTRRSDGAREIRASHRMMQVNERELQRLLLDIHDGPVQHVYAALSQVDPLRPSLLQAPGGVPPEADERMERIRRLLEAGLTEVRTAPSSARCGRRSSGRATW